jgi:hypothetical protein
MIRVPVDHDPNHSLQDLESIRDLAFASQMNVFSPSLAGSVIM